MPDRDVFARLPQVALHQLPRSIDRPLKRPRHHEPRTDLADIVIKDRLAAHIPKLRGELPQPLGLDRRIGRQLLTDPVLERIQLRRRSAPAHTAAAAPPPTLGGPSFDATPVRRLISRIESCSTRRQPPDLRPLLHADHTRFLLADRHRSNEGPDPAGQHRPHARWVTFQPAQVDQYSAGAHHGRYRLADGRPAEPRSVPATALWDSCRSPRSTCRGGRIHVGDCRAAARHSGAATAARY